VAGSGSSSGHVELRFVDGGDPLMREVLDLCYEALHRPFDVSRNDDWGNEDPWSWHLVALDAGNVIGYARLIREGEWGHIRQVAVYEEYRRRGIGGDLVCGLVDLARREGFDRLYLNARLNAVGLYERAGFRVVSPKPFPMPRTYLPHVRMEMELGPEAGPSR
jgi:N-acetylglutamate synthase-like GNAT family acetyltransferase